MRLFNNTDNNLMHDTCLLKVGETKEVPDNIAKKWLKFEGVEEVITKDDLKKAVEEAKKSKSKKSK